MEKKGAQGMGATNDTGGTMLPLDLPHEALVRELQKISAKLTGVCQDYKSIDSTQ